MGDADAAIHPSKKRSAGREITKDNPGDEDDNNQELETGTFQKASDEVLATRRIVKVRRTAPTQAVPSSNPFAGIRFTPTETPKVDEAPASIVANQKAEVNSGVEQGPAFAKPNEEDRNVEVENDKKDTKVEDDNDDSTADSNAATAPGLAADSNAATAPGLAAESTVVEEKTTPVGLYEKEASCLEELQKASEIENGNGSTDTPVGTPLNSFQQLSSNQNAFMGITGTGFSSSSFSFGSIPKDGSAFGVGSFGSSAQKPSFDFGNSNNGTSSLFGSGSSPNILKTESSNITSMQEVPVETGEENEKCVFAADAVLFEYLDGGWKERGKGELKVNVSASGVQKSRLVMRARGIFRLVLNASIYPEMKFTNMDKRGVTFACINSVGEGKGGLSTFALKFKDGTIKEEFHTVVKAHNSKQTGTDAEGKDAAVLKTPENSPKASDD